MNEYEIIDQKYPCKFRRGMGYTGCKCNNDYRQDPRFVDCAAYGTHGLAVTNCIDCPFRPRNPQTQPLNG